MRLPFLDRDDERSRLARTLDAADGGVACLYGRRRLGKSRLIREVIRNRTAVYYVGDQRDAALQREALAREMARLKPGFADVLYPEWDALLSRWWSEAPVGAALVVDELPALVTTSPELPSVLQKLIDRTDSSRHLVLCGSSQRMMHGLVLDATAPLYGRAQTIVKLGPLDLQWIGPALGVRDPADAVEHYATWGGVPRYWELAGDHPDRAAAVTDLVLSPNGVLHREPERLLLDDVREIARSASILALIGAGCHRMSEIAARIGVPATSLSRPLARLIDLELVRRDVPFGKTVKSSKQTLYRIADPFVAYWYRFVEPNRSRLEANQISGVAGAVARAWPQYLGTAWESIARDRVARVELFGRAWLPARRWWGGAADGTRLELDIVAAAADGSDDVLVGEAKLTMSPRDAATALTELSRKAARCPALRGRQVLPALFALRHTRRISDPRVLGASDLVRPS